MQDSLRRSKVSLVVFGPLAVAAGVATFVADRSMVVANAQLSLPSTGAGAGNTTAAIKLNGTAIATATIAGAAASKTATVPAYMATTTQPYPAGVSINAGDVITVDITAVPATTVPAGAVVYLDVVQVDV